MLYLSDLSEGLLRWAVDELKQISVRVSDRGKVKLMTAVQGNILGLELHTLKFERDVRNGIFCNGRRVSETDSGKFIFYTKGKGKSNSSSMIEGLIR